MNMTLREVLARQANDAGLPDLDIEELVGLGENRLRRRRFTAVVGGAAAVVVVIAFALGAAQNRWLEGSDGPVDRPTSSPNELRGNRSGRLSTATSSESRPATASAAGQSTTATAWSRLATGSCTWT